MALDLAPRGHPVDVEVLGGLARGAQGNLPRFAPDEEGVTAHLGRHGDERPDKVPMDSVSGKIVNPFECAVLVLISRVASR
jgi:hypothetical protein